MVGREKKKRESEGREDIYSHIGCTFQSEREGAGWRKNNQRVEYWKKEGLTTTMVVISWFLDIGGVIRGVQGGKWK